MWIVVSLEWFPIMPSDTPFRAPGHMQTAYPDYRHYTSREYGTRVGFYRLLDAFAKVGVTRLGRGQRRDRRTLSVDHRATSSRPGTRSSRIRPT